MSDDDPVERERVFSRISPTILAFREVTDTFHMEELREYVLQLVPGIAPDSPSRILRAMRQMGMVNYVVINRRQSLYQFRAPEPARPSFPVDEGGQLSWI